MAQLVVGGVQVNADAVIVKGEMRVGVALGLESVTSNHRVADVGSQVQLVVDELAVLHTGALAHVPQIVILHVHLHPGGPGVVHKHTVGKRVVVAALDYHALAVVVDICLRDRVLP